MTADQRQALREALAAKAKAARNQRGKRKRGLATVTRAGMVRVNPGQDVPAPGGAAPKETA